MIRFSPWIKEAYRSIYVNNLPCYQGKVYFADVYDRAELRFDSPVDPECIDAVYAEVDAQFGLQRFTFTELLNAIRKAQ